MGCAEKAAIQIQGLVREEEEDLATDFLGGGTGISREAAAARTALQVLRMTRTAGVATSSDSGSGVSS